MEVTRICHGIKLNCEFEDETEEEGLDSFYDFKYCCTVKSLEYNENMTVDGYNGDHKPNRNDSDVEAIFLYSLDIFKVPSKIGFLFHLIYFYMEYLNLTEISSDDFQGMQDLEKLYIVRNNLSFIPSDAFITLTKLKYLIMGSNQIEELPIGLFSNNLDLEFVHLQDNKIKYVASGLFNELTKLNSLMFHDNICFPNDHELGIIQMKKHIEKYCKSPNQAIEVKMNEITTEIKTELVDMNKMMKQLLNDIGVQQKDKIMIDILGLQLSEAKDQLKSNHQKNANEMNKIAIELNELKEQLQMEKSTCREFRTKLVKANEQLSSTDKQ